jgi:hypothetical protein
MFEELPENLDADFTLRRDGLIEGARIPLALRGSG